MELQTQKRIINKLEADGWYVIKLMKTNRNGIPDLLAVKHDKTMFIEVKQPNGKLSPLQVFRINEMRQRGLTVFIWIDYETDFKSGSIKN